MSSTPLFPALALLGLLALPGLAHAKDAQCSISVKKDDLVSRGKLLIVEGDQSKRDAVALEGDVVVRAGARVKDVVALQGNVKVEAGAHIEGKVTALGGDIHVASGATIKGDISALGGKLHVAKDATLSGEKNQLSISINGDDPIQLLMGHVFPGKGAANCELRIED